MRFGEEKKEERKKKPQSKNMMVWLFHRVTITRIRQQAKRRRKEK